MRCLNLEWGAQIKLAGMTTSLFEAILHRCWRHLEVIILANVFPVTANTEMLDQTQVTPCGQT